MLSRVTITTSYSTAGTGPWPLSTVFGATTTRRSRHPYREFRRTARQRLQRLVDGHRLRAGRDALQRDRFGVLAGDQHLARESLLAQRLDGAARRAVVAREHRIDVRAAGGDRGVDDALGVLGLPVLRPVLVHHDDVAARDVRLEHAVLAALELRGVVVGLGAEDAHDAPVARRRQVVDEEARLQLAHPLVVEAHVQVEVAVADDAVVGDHRDAGVVRQPHRLGHGGAVVRHDHQHVDAAGDQLLDVADLHRVVAVRREHQHPRAQLAGALDEHVAVGLPARFLERVEREPDGDAVILPLCFTPAAGAERQPDQHARDQRRDHQQDAQVHGAGRRRIAAPPLLASLSSRVSAAVTGRCSTTRSYGRVCQSACGPSR